jgi:hypothetical protein
MPLNRLRTRDERTAGCAVVDIDGDVDVSTAELLRMRVITAALSITDRGSSP